MKALLGIDVGSISTKLAVLDDELNVRETLYLRTRGQPAEVVKEALATLLTRLPQEIKIAGTGVTGSGRKLIAKIVDADTVKNEIIAQGIAAISLIKDVKTVVEIGGQDSKLIIIRDGVITDFAMNTICAAGTGSFLDHQAERLGIKIEDFGFLALKSKTKVNIAGRCTVFAESDMICKAQTGTNREDILAGLCRAIVRNYLSNLVKGKNLLAPIVFLGGVAYTLGIKKAFEKELGLSIIVPAYHNVSGAIGAAILAKEETAVQIT